MNIRRSISNALRNSSSTVSHVSAGADQSRTGHSPSRTSGPPVRAEYTPERIVLGETARDLARTLGDLRASVSAQNCRSSHARRHDSTARRSQHEGRVNELVRTHCRWPELVTCFSRRSRRKQCDDSSRSSPTPAGASALNQSLPSGWQQSPSASSAQAEKGPGPVAGRTPSLLRRSRVRACRECRWC